MKQKGQSHGSDMMKSSQILLYIDSFFGLNMRIIETPSRDPNHFNWVTVLRVL